MVTGIPLIQGTFLLCVFPARAGNEDSSEGAEVPGPWDLQHCLQLEGFDATLWTTWTTVSSNVFLRGPRTERGRPQTLSIIWTS